MPHLSHVFTLTMKFARQCRQLVQKCSGLTVDLDLSDPIANLQYDDAQICPIWGGPPKKNNHYAVARYITTCSIYPVYRILGLNVMKCYECSSWPTQWSLQGIIHVRRCEAAKALQERFPTRGQTTARGDVLSTPVVQGCLLSFWEKKLYFSRVFFSWCLEIFFERCFFSWFSLETQIPEWYEWNIIKYLEECEKTCSERVVSGSFCYMA